MCGAQFGGEETSWIGFTEPIFCGGDFVRRGKLVGIWVLPFVLPVGRGMPALFYSSFFCIPSLSPFSSFRNIVSNYEGNWHVSPLNDANGAASIFYARIGQISSRAQVGFCISGIWI